MEKLPRGTFRNEIGSDGYDEPVTLHAELTILPDAIEVDFLDHAIAGSADAVGRAGARSSKKPGCCRSVVSIL